VQVAFVLKTNACAMKLIRSSFLFLMAVLIGCHGPHDELMVVSTKGPAQGTFYNITYLAPKGVDHKNSIDSLLYVIDQSMSLWQPNSTISRLNRGDTLDREIGFVHLINVFKVAQKIARESNGAFDISVAPLVNYWGFGPEAHANVDSSKADSLRQFVGYEKLQTIVDSGFLRPGMQIDMNAIAQGYSVDLVAQFLDEQGIQNYLVEIGGEIKTRGTNYRGDIWTVGVNKPSEDSKVAQELQVIVGLDSAALATSGNYRKFWVDEKTGAKYVHTINPQTGYPARTRLLSATIVTDNCAEADAWATACMVLGLEKAKSLVEKNQQLEAYFVYSDVEGNWQEWQTPGFERITQ
jgi:thiamine biosynthesis lipoprotein